jgi:hypothetical protein
MLTVIGPLAAPDGIMRHRDRDGKSKVSRLPPVGYLREQRKVPLMIGHNETVGRVVDLQRSDKLGLMCVATIASQPRLGSPTPIRNTFNVAPIYPLPTHNDEYVAELLGGGDDWYFSPTADARSISPGHHERATLREVSLVPNPASINLDPVRWVPTDIADGSGPPRDWSWPWKDTWKHAYERVNHHGYRYSDRLLIDDLDELDPVDECITTGDTAALVAFAKSRLAPDTRPSRPLKPQPPAKTPASPRVRFDGRELDEGLSRRVLDWLENDVDLSVIRRRVAGLMG